jgi:hypothetical protein
MFHLELRQFPHVARAFNLSREDLDARFSRPWVSGSAIDHADRRWTPDRASLKIFEGPELRPDEIGMGRGWATVGKTSKEVTETVLAEAERGSEGRSAVETFRAAVLGAARTPITFGEVVELAVAEYPLWRASERLALAEQAIWELLHQGGLTLNGLDGPIESERWQPILLSWSTWIDAGPDPLLLQAGD